MKRINPSECKVKFPVSINFNRHVITIDNPRETLYPRDSYQEKNGSSELPSYKFQVKIINTRKNTLLNIPMFSGYVLWNVGIAEIDEGILFETLQNIIIHSFDDRGDTRRYLVTKTTKDKIRNFFNGTETASKFLISLNQFIKERNKII